MPASATYPAPGQPAAYSPVTAGPPSALQPATGCASCCVRPYCALAAPDSLYPPANCPFGLGQPAR